MDPWPNKESKIQAMMKEDKENLCMCTWVCKKENIGCNLCGLQN